MTNQRFDYAEIKATKTDEGYLKDSPIVARTGILEYRNADGSLRRELRLPEDVFHEDSLSSFHGKPITVDHPSKGKVSSSDTHLFTVGTILSNGRAEGENLRVDTIIHNPAALGDRRQLSVGYDVELDETPGEWNGQRYDAIQRKIRVNHLSVVKRGRAGNVARLNLDSDEEITELVNMSKIRLDTGIEYEAPQEVVAEVNKLRNDISEAVKTVQAKENAVANVTKERDTLQARVDGFEAEKKTIVADAIVSAKARIQLESTASAFKIDCAGKTDREIKEAVVKLVRKDAFDPSGKSDDYVNAAFDMSIDEKSRNDSAIASQRQIVNPEVSTNRNDSEEDSYENYRKRTSAK